MVEIDKNFERALNRLAKFEGGYVNDKDDKGGETNWGISKAVAREYGYKGEMKDLSKKTANNIYYNLYRRAFATSLQSIIC